MSQIIEFDKDKRLAKKEKEREEQLRKEIYQRILKQADKLKW